MQHRDVGELETFTCTPVGADGKPTVPATLDLTITPPLGGAVITKALADFTHSADGSYTWDEPMIAAGGWRYEFASTMPNVTEGGLVVVGDEPYEGPYEPWTTIEEVLRHPSIAALVALYPTLLDDFDRRELESIIDAASEVMFNLSERAYPGYRRVQRSFPRCYSCGAWWWAPYWYGYHLCGCAPSAALCLRTRYPVVAWLRVILNDVELVAGADFTVEWQCLRRAKGALWPKASDLTDVRGFRVEYVTGVRVPEAGRRAATALVALDLAQALTAALATCGSAPDAREISEVREGITLRLQDVASMIAAGSTGFTKVDLWLKSIKAGRQVPSGILNPARVGARRRGW